MAGTLRRRTFATPILGVLAALVSSLLGRDPAEAACKLNLIAELPVTMQGMRALIPAKINGADVTFMADSGAFFSTIKPSKAAELKLEVRNLDRVRVSGVAGEAEAGLTYVRSFGLLGANLKNVAFVVTSGSDDGLAGVLGQNLLSLGDADYDLSHGRIRLLRPADCGDAPLAYWAGTRPFSTVTMERPDDFNRVTIGVINVNGKPLRALFDTGALTTISRSAAERAGVKITDPGVQFLGVGGGVGASAMRLWSAEFATVAIGDEEIRHAHLHISERLGSGIDMLLGADFFISHRVYVARSQRKFYVTYEGGPVFQMETKALEKDAPGGPEHPLETVAQSDGAPKTAGEFARRAAARLSRKDAAGALADYNEALTLDPSQADWYLARAETHATLRDGKAPADLDAAIDHDPLLARARLMRARLEIVRGAREAARADIDAVAARAPKESDFHRETAPLYAALRDQRAALQEYDKWLGSHPDDFHAIEAYNGRCWARALLGTDLDGALSDCNHAVRALPGAANFRDSRGLVQLRRRRYVDAIADYDAALRIDPKLAWSLYGRGVAKVRSGHAEEGEADIKAALSVDPKIADTARSWGVDPAAPPS